MSKNHLKFSILVIFLRGFGSWSENKLEIAFFLLLLGKGLCKSCVTSFLSVCGIPVNSSGPEFLFGGFKLCIQLL